MSFVESLEPNIIRVGAWWVLQFVVRSTIGWKFQHIEVKKGINVQIIHWCSNYDFLFVPTKLFIMDRSLNMELISFESSFNVSPLIASYLQP
jgi:hypothetical protein